MALITHDPTKKRVFTPASERGDERPWRLHIRSEEDASQRYTPLVFKISKENPKASTLVVKLMAYACDWENADQPQVDAEGEPIREQNGEIRYEPTPFETDEDGNALMTTILKIPSEWRTEALQFIANQESLTETDRKNSA